MTPSHTPLIDALKEIEDMEGMTLLGRCCVDKECRPYDESRCELQSKVASAFSQAAQVAKKALTDNEASYHSDQEIKRELLEALKEAVDEIHGEFCGYRCHELHLKFIPIIDKASL